MQKYKAKKEVVEQVTSKLKNTENRENKGKLGEISSISDDSSKLQASKNIFTRGDFDEYKIKNLGITEDGCTYNLDNPTERYYYELKKELEKKRADSCNEDIEKGLHKYISKKFENGKWVYKYHQDRKQAVKNLISCSEPLLKCNINNAKIEGEKFLKDWNIDWNNNPNKSKSSVLGKHISIIVKDANGNDGISLLHFAHKRSTKNQPRDPNEILMRAKLLPIAKEMLENKNKATVYEVRNDGNYVEYSLVGKFIQNGKEKKVCVIIYKNKKEGNVYLSVMRKAISLDNDIAFITDVFLLKPSKNVQFSAEQRAYSERPFPNRDYSISKSNNMSSDINKSLTYSGHKLQGRTKLYGMDISIENKKGSYRSGVDGDGHKWKCFMHYDYGYIRETVGTDGDHLDCYIGPDKESQKVYVIHQNNPVTHKYDEDKCMLCFATKEDAKKAYMKQYDRPGFYGSMDILTIDEFKSYVFSKKGKMIHKSFEIKITDITESNKQFKVEQLEKSLMAIAENKPFVIKHIPSGKTSKKISDITLKIHDFDRNKIQKAVHNMAFTLDTELKSSKGEAFLYKAQEQLTDRIVSELTEKTKSVYTFLINYLGLPEMRIVTKADVEYKGKVIYSPETGKPMTKDEWNKFVKALENILNSNYSGSGEKIVLSATTLGIILEKLSKTNTLASIKKMELEKLNYGHRKFDWISKTAENMKNAFGESLTRDFQARIQIAIDSAAMRVTRVEDAMRDNIQQIVIDGIKNKQSKSNISQELFNTCTSMNRDFQKIADTEIQNNTNWAYINEQVYNSNDGEKVYFKRVEQLDDITCKKCKAADGTIVLYSDIPLSSEEISDPNADYAIWEGKMNGKYPIVNFHPYCRGCWVRYYPKHGFDYFKYGQEQIENQEKNKK